MAEKKFGKGSMEWALFMDFWNLCQMYWEPEENDEWWQEVSREINKFSEKYGNAVFPRMLGLALSDKLEEEVRNKCRRG